MIHTIETPVFWIITLARGNEQHPITWVSQSMKRMIIYIWYCHLPMLHTYWSLDTSGYKWYRLSSHLYWHKGNSYPHDGEFNKWAVPTTTYHNDQNSNRGRCHSHKQTTSGGQCSKHCCNPKEWPLGSRSHAVMCSGRWQNEKTHHIWWLAWRSRKPDGVYWKYIW